MLVLTRKSGESICIGNDIRISVAAISGNRVKICIDAPKECAVRRNEIAAGQRQNRGVQFPTGAVAR